MSIHLNAPSPAFEARLRSEPTAWLSSMREDGRPHVVPVWFSWDGSVFDFFSKPSAQKVRNLRQHADVMLAIGQPNESFDVELVEGKATVLRDPTAAVIRPTMFEKYAELMVRAALDRQTFVLTYSQPVRITPTRFLRYGGKGWTDPALTPDGEDDVSGHISMQRWTDAQRGVLEEISRIANGASRPIELLALDD